LERSGNNQKGSITAIYTILTQADYQGDALAEEVVSILDGHIILDPKLQRKGILPAIHPTRSLSRLINKLHSSDEIRDIESIKKIFHLIETEKDFVNFGSTPSAELSQALSMEEDLEGFLKQAYNSPSSFHDSMTLLKQILNKIG